MRTNTVIGPGGDAAVLRLRGSNRAIAVKTDCNGRYVYLSPRNGARIAVCEAARNVACTGARPLAITNCLNFGNPKRPENFFQLSEAIAGIGEACRALDTPVTGGNVSLYNESPSGAVYPTPVIGMLGLIDDLAHVTGSTWSGDDDVIVLLGEMLGGLGGSEYLAHVHGVVAGEPPPCDPKLERDLIDCLLECIRGGHVRSAHDCSDGGLGVALAECAMADRTRLMGAEIDLSAWGDMPLRELLYNEAQGRIVVTIPEASLAAVAKIAAAHRIPPMILGRVRAGSKDLVVKTGSRTIVAPLERLAAAYHGAIPAIMEKSVESAAVLEQAAVTTV